MRRDDNLLEVVSIVFRTVDFSLGTSRRVGAHLLFHLGTKLKNRQFAKPYQRVKSATVLA